MRDSELNLSSYNIFRSDRCPLYASRGGGVLIAVCKKLHSTQINITESSCLEIDELFIKISVSNSELILGAFYVPPSADISCYEDHISSIQECKLEYPNLNYIILGDYNLPNVDWLKFDNKCQYRPRNDIPSYLLENITFLVDSMSSLDLYQRNIYHNHCNNVLDLCFSNFDCNISLVLDEFIYPDVAHPVIDLHFYLPPLLTNINYTTPMSYDYYKLDFKSANYTVINCKLSNIDWHYELDFLPVLEATDKFYSIILSIIDNEVPNKHLKLSTFPNWFSYKLINLIFRKKEAHKNYKQSLESFNNIEAKYFKSQFILIT